jgi:hypothetical protein
LHRTARRPWPRAQPYLRRCAPPLHAGTSGLAGRTRAARARFRPADEQRGSDVIGRLAQTRAVLASPISPARSTSSASPSMISSRPG